LKMHRLQLHFKKNKAKWHKSCNLRYNKTQLIRAQKHKAEIDVSHTTTGTPGERETGKKNRSKVDVFDPKSYACLLCEQPALPGTLRNDSTFDLDQKVHACAVELNDKGLLVKLASGDLISQEAKYHSKCLVSLYNQCRFAVNARLGKNKNTVCKGLALADII